MEGDEYATFPPLPGDRHPSAGHPLSALRPHPRLPARQHQRGSDRALPPGPPRSTRYPHPITEPALGRGRHSTVDVRQPKANSRRLAPQTRQQSRSVVAALSGERAKTRRYGRSPGHRAGRRHGRRTDADLRGAAGSTSTLAHSRREGTAGCRAIHFHRSRCPGTEGPRGRLWSVPLGLSPHAGNLGNEGHERRLVEMHRFLFTERDF
jgi:hypothetical protein